MSTVCVLLPVSNGSSFYYVEEILLGFVFIVVWTEPAIWKQTLRTYYTMHGGEKSHKWWFLPRFFLVTDLWSSQYARLGVRYIARDKVNFVCNFRKIYTYNGMNASKQFSYFQATPKIFIIEKLLRNEFKISLICKQTVKRTSYRRLPKS